MSREQLFEILSEAVNVSDKTGHIDLGDQILEVIAYLKEEWREEDDQ